MKALADYFVLIFCMVYGRVIYHGAFQVHSA